MTFQNDLLHHYGHHLYSTAQQQDNEKHNGDLARSTVNFKEPITLKMTYVLFITHTNET